MLWARDDISAVGAVLEAWVANAVAAVDHTLSSTLCAIARSVSAAIANSAQSSIAAPADLPCSGLLLSLSHANFPLDIVSG